MSSLINYFTFIDLILSFKIVTILFVKSSLEILDEKNLIKILMSLNEKD